MASGAVPLRVGRLTRDGALVGYLAVDTQQWRSSKRTGLRVRRWSETRRRYRLDFLSDWDDGFLADGDDAQLDPGRFRFKGEVLRFEELMGDEKDAMLSQRFADWD